MAYTNSPLVTYTKLSPNNSGQRTHSIDRITPHCVVGQLTVQQLGDIFARPARRASSNYGIGVDGQVGMYVEEKNRSWCSASRENDQRAITIECASNKKKPYDFNEKVWNKLIELCVDICKRNGKKKLLWLGNKEKSLAYSPKKDEMVLTCHRWFDATACPGEWMYDREADLAEKVTAKLNLTPTPKPDTNINVIYQVYDEVTKKWTSKVTNKESYAGKFGDGVSCVYAETTKGNIYYKVHTLKNKKWLPEVKNREDFAGNKGQVIDAFCAKINVKGKTLCYRVHLKKDKKWLDWVTGYNTNDSKNGYAGIIGKEIDAVQMYIK